MSASAIKYLLSSPNLDLLLLGRIREGSLCTHVRKIPCYEMGSKNLYHRRLVAESGAKACWICYRPSSTVLITPENDDWFHICPGHLKDTKFATAKDAEDLAEKKRQEELEKEIEAVKKEFEEKMRKKLDRRKQKEYEKEGKKEEKKKEAKQDEADEKEKEEKLKELEKKKEPAKAVVAQRVGSLPGLANPHLFFRTTLFHQYCSNLNNKR